jgi:hypothetical protein
MFVTLLPGDCVQESPPFSFSLLDTELPQEERFLMCVNRTVAQDGLISVRRGFRLEEWRGLADRAGIPEVNMPVSTCPHRSAGTVKNCARPRTELIHAVRMQIGLEDGAIGA